MLGAVLLGGFIGLLVGGGSGFIIGAIIAVLLQGYVKQRIGAGLSSIRSGFFDSMFAVMGALCKADGVVSANEVQAAENVFNQLRLNAAQREAAITAFNRGKQPDFDMDAELLAFRQLSRGHPALLQMFLQIQITAVAADGQVHPAEHQMLLRIARGLGLPESQVEQLEAMLRGQSTGQRSPGERLDEAYKILGVNASVSDAELKRAYRKLMNENHPDKLASQGLPENLRKMAEQKAGEIAAAYDVIRESRRVA